jgi:hypothetical protein
MKTNLKNVELDVRNAKNQPEQISNDKFIQIMEPYVKDAQTRYETLELMSQKMTKAYKELSEFYCIDSKTTIGEFFSDLLAFCTQFKVSFLSLAWTVCLDLKYILFFFL